MPDRAELGETVTNERQRDCLVRARDALERGIDSFKAKAPAEIVSADLRETLQALDEIVGRTYTEDILGRIFSKFCIGK
jgi:tRNA modification GTPase